MLLYNDMEKMNVSDLLSELESIVDVNSIYFDKRSKIYKKIDNLLNEKKPTKKNILGMIKKVNDYIKTDKAKEIKEAKQEKKRKEAEKRKQKKEAEKKKLIKNVKNNIIDLNTETFGGYDATDRPYVYEAVKSFVKDGIIKGKDFFVGLYVNNKLAYGKYYNDVITLSKWWKTGFKPGYKNAIQHWATSNSSILYNKVINFFDPNGEYFEPTTLNAKQYEKYVKKIDEKINDAKLNLIIYELGSVDEKYIKQIFRGQGLCWLGEIETYYINKLKERENKTGIKPNNTNKYFKGLFSKINLNEYAQEEFKEFDEIEQTIINNKRIESNGFDKFLKKINSKDREKKDHVANNIKRTLEKIQFLKQKYCDGLPEDTYDEICKELNINVTIYDVFGKIMKEYKSNYDNMKTFKFINNKFNHVDPYFDTNGVIELNSDDMYKLYVNNIDRCLYKRDGLYIKSIKIGNQLYVLQDDDKKARKEYKNEIKSFFVNTDSDEYQFVQKSILHNKDIDFGLKTKEIESEALGDIIKKTIYDTEGVKAMDISKAYGRYYLNKYYMGLPTIFNNFRNLGFKADKEWLSERIGFFQCSGFNGNNRWMKLGLKDGIILGTPEILFFLDQGVTCNLVCGLWNCKKGFDGLIFDEDFVERKLYTSFIGQLDMKVNNDYWLINGEKNFASILKFLGYKTNYNNDVITIHSEKAVKRSYCHIASYIQMYSRIRVYERIAEMNEEDVLAIKTDCIYYKGDYDYWEGWREEKNIILDNFNKEYYEAYNIIKIDSDYFDNCDQDLFLAGMGGTGKTHSVCTDKGYKGLLYTALCWSLVADCINKYKIKGFSINTVAGIDCRPVSEEQGFNPGVIIIDEMTMNSREIVEHIKNIHPYSQIILIGDMDEQGRPFQCAGVNFNGFDMKPYKYILRGQIDYRAKDCNKLQELKQKLRTYTENYFEHKKFLNPFTLRTYTERTLKQMKELVKNYCLEGDLNDYDHLNDLIIVSTNKQIETYNEMWCHFPKFKMIKQARINIYKRIFGGKDYVINGEYINEDLSGSDLRHASTCHSVQGLTCEGNVYIDLNYLFDINQIYTAVSRARNINQIKFIEN